MVFERYIQGILKIISVIIDWYIKGTLNSQERYIKGILNILHHQ